MEKIGIIGSGAVGKALANGLHQAGYSVMMGSRDLSNLDGVEGVEKGSVADTCAFSDLLVLAVKGTAAVEALAGQHIDGKVIIDTTNPIAGEPPKDGVLKFFSNSHGSLIEQLQAAYPQAHFVKAFNSVGSHLMCFPDFGGTKPTMFICGNHDGSRQQVSHLLAQLGWDTEDAGTAAAGAALESLCVLWCIRGFRQGEWAHAFKLLRK